MDRIDRAITAAFHDQPHARQVAVRYGLSRFRQQVRRHIATGELRIVRMCQEPEAVQRAMVAVSLALDSDGHQPARRWMLTAADERRLFADGFRGQPLRLQPSRSVLP